MRQIVSKNKYILPSLIAIFILMSLILSSCGNAGTSGKKDELLDLTELNSNALYAAVYDIMASPDEYLGRKIKVKGYFAVGDNGSGDVKYFFCVIPDAAGCCQQGMEFLLKGEPGFPEGYPSENEDIIVEGIFSEHKEGKGKFYRLDEASVKALGTYKEASKKAALE